jgi:hypothetical protein
MRALLTALAAASLVMLSAGVSIAGAVSGPDANPNSKFVYTEEIVSSDLVVAFDEGGQKRMVTVEYKLDATVTKEIDCGGGVIAISVDSASDTVTGLMPDDKGRVVGELTLAAAGGPSPCLQTILRRIDYTDVTLTNVTTGHVYRLDPISQEYSS